MYKRLAYSRGGFTLIELIIVIAILGILASVAVPLVGNYVTQAQKQTITNDMNEVYKYSVIAIQELQSQGDDLAIDKIVKRVNEISSLDVKYGLPNIRERGDSIRISYDNDILIVGYYEDMASKPKYEIIDKEFFER